MIVVTDTPNNFEKRSINDRAKRLIKIKVSNDRIQHVDAILRNVTERGIGIELQLSNKDIAIGCDDGRIAGLMSRTIF